MLDKVDFDQARTEAFTSLRTDRDAKFYFDVFDYGEKGEKIAGKKILNIGAGDSNFSSAVRSMGVGTVVDLGSPICSGSASRRGKSSCSFSPSAPVC